MQYKWLAIDHEKAGVHVVPENDEIDHVLSWNCICGPKFDGVMCEQGHLHTQIVHEALDGRP